MRFSTALVAGAIACSLPVFAITADAHRGFRFFSQQKCDTCHSVGQAVKGRGNAPDLAVSAGREYTPSGLAARMWNHAPTMWDQLAKSGMRIPSISEQDAADLYAFFYSARYFDQAADAGRGKAAFQQKHCADCHALAPGGSLAGPPVSNWQSLNDPIALVDRMWNHQSQMDAESGKRKLAWPQLTSQNLDDMLLYLRTSPGVKASVNQFQLATGADGKQLFESKGCANCHHGANSLDNRLSNQTLSGIAVAMWNHAPRMKQRNIQLTEDEMRQLVGYLWGNEFFASKGNPAHGRKVFETKQCAGCHEKGAAPKIEGNPHFSDIALVSALWKHGPAMLATMKSQNQAWPQLTAAQMSDLVAYLASPK